MIRLQRGPYPPLHGVCRRLAESTSPVEHGAVADDDPRVIRDPNVPLSTFWLGLLARESECFEVES